MFRKTMIIIVMMSAATTAGAGQDDAASMADKTREVRSLEKQIAKLQERYDKLIKRCTGDNHNRPDARACDTARLTYRDVQELKNRINELTKE